MRSFIRILAWTQASTIDREIPVTTLTTNPCAGVLARLFAEAEASDARLDEWTKALAAGEHAQLMTGARDFRQFYGRLKDFHLAVSRPTASLLYMLARACRAETIIEFGTSFGVSTLHLAAALRDNGQRRRTAHRHGT
jgi:predicted O-methyltransferase YrrM